MKISGVSIRPGNIIEYEGGIWRAVKIQHTQPGKGGAYMQVELKNLIDGRKNNVRFRSAETVERVRLDTKDFQFLFADGDMLTFMDKDTYEQISLPRDLLGDAAAFYHVHSYACEPALGEDVVGLGEYGTPFVSIVEQYNLMSVQFHPEKSSRDGLTLLGNFARLGARVAA